MGSEMCIRDRLLADDVETAAREAEKVGFPLLVKAAGGGGGIGMHCLLYTSDAADQRSSGDLGGRRFL